MNEWLSLMLDEIRRKQREREEASRERAQREDAAAPRGKPPGETENAVDKD